jgi:NAD(P)-dependent dehydrogenase (short-subunit alcohol dehydrogenase family)
MIWNKERTLLVTGASGHLGRRVAEILLDVGIHFGTFRLADDGQDEAPERIATLLREGKQPPPQFWVLGVGESREVPVVELSRRVAR